MKEILGFVAAIHLTEPAWMVLSGAALLSCASALRRVIPYQRT